MRWQTGEPSPAQIDPATLDGNDTWARTCQVCGMCTQGGRGGLSAHTATVHPKTPPPPGGGAPQGKRNP